ncbi:MAG: chemotaxis protein CheD [Candidatus Aenigmarchaeota archaeon]|nr:chemotaxis protein CheD [Candidatus Aenigmarchaeota archaeon]
MKGKTIIGIGEIAYDRRPNIISTLGLGSCVGLCLYDKERKIGALCHIMLPRQMVVFKNDNLNKYANFACKNGIEGLLKRGAVIKDVVAKIAGGAQMFDNFIGKMDIGAENVASIKNELAKYNIHIIAKDIGGNYGRSIDFDLETNKIFIRRSKGNENIVI